MKAVRRAYARFIFFFSFFNRFISNLLEAYSVSEGGTLGTQAYVDSYFGLFKLSF